MKPKNSKNSKTDSPNNQNRAHPMRKGNTSNKTKIIPTVCIYNQPAPRAHKVQIKSNKLINTTEVLFPNNLKHNPRTPINGSKTIKIENLDRRLLSHFDDCRSIYVVGGMNERCGCELGRSWIERLVKTWALWLEADVERQGQLSSDGEWWLRLQLEGGNL